MAGPPVDVAGWQSEARWLADPAREGRGLGTAGLAAAAQHLAARFAEAGLEPGAADGSFLHTFRMPVAIEVAQVRLALGNERLVRKRDFRVGLNSEDGSFSGPLVFAGYGIDDEVTGWNDWAGLEPRDAVVLVLDGRPDQPAFADRRGTALGRRGAKLLAAREHGARVVVFVPNGPASEPSFESPMGPAPTLSPSGLIVFALSSGAAERVARSAGFELDALVRAAEDRVRPSLHGARMSGAVRIERREGEVSNVIGRLPGGDAALAHEQVVIGAHYDHLGRGEFGSMRPEAAARSTTAPTTTPRVRPPCSSSRAPSRRGPRPARTLVLAAFTGEEVGLIGSARLRRARRCRSETSSMVNLDMIGRLGENGVNVFGSDSAAGFADLVRRSAERHATRRSPSKTASTALRPRELPHRAHPGAVLHHRRARRLPHARRPQRRNLQRTERSACSGWSPT